MAREKAIVENSQTAYEVFGFSDVPLNELKQILIDMGFNHEVEGDYPHNSDLSVCAVAFPNKPDKESPYRQQNRITLGSGVNSDIVPVNILKDLKERVPDFTAFDAMGVPIVIEKSDL